MNKGFLLFCLLFFFMISNMKSSYCPQAISDITISMPHNLIEDFRNIHNSTSDYKQYRAGDMSNSKYIFSFKWIFLVFLILFILGIILL